MKPLSLTDEQKQAFAVLYVRLYGKDKTHIEDFFYDIVDIGLVEMASRLDFMESRKGGLIEIGKEAEE